MDKELSCKACEKSFPARLAEQQVRYCPYCGTLQADLFKGGEKLKRARDDTHTFNDEAPAQDRVLFCIGPYHIVEHIGKGGMGEVFFAYDSVCGRHVALKRIRTDLQTHSKLYKRFLREARLTSQLSHPAIMPIYSIHRDGHLMYYTMPRIEGRTLRDILRLTRQQERDGEEQDPVGRSLPALLRIFLSVCQAVAFAHSRGVLHRDLKPENIIVGKYGQITILDWGLAKLVGEISDDDGEEPDVKEEEGLTHPGKVVGTVTHMAPERARGNPATEQTDVYALGVMLYQLLTLRQPFRRKNLERFRKIIDTEVLQPPEEIAPYRDVPPLLSRVVSKCLAADPELRYKHTSELISDLEAYMGGKSGWMPITTLDVKQPDDWAFQASVLLGEHMAITRHHEVTDWVNLMVSAGSFPGNVKLETEITIGDRGAGIGLILCAPPDPERSVLNEGYCLWLDVEQGPGTRLYRSNLQVMHQPHIALERRRKYKVCFQKVDEKICFYLDDELQFCYVGHLPLKGSQIALVAKDADYDISDITVSVGGLDLNVSCLAVPDAFLAYQDYDRAMTDYQRIAESFPGRAEGREALFRWGITCLEKAQAANGPTGLWDQAMELFERLRHTPSAPMEYLGKALAYEAQGDVNEEINCLELGYRRYHKHPMVHVLREQIVYRMNECSRSDRNATYRFALLVLQQIPKILDDENILRLLANLRKHWESLPHIIYEQDVPGPADLALSLAYRLGRPHAVVETLETLLEEEGKNWSAIENGIFSLIVMKQLRLAEDLWEDATSRMSGDATSEWRAVKEVIDILKEEKPERGQKLAAALPAEVSRREARPVLTLMQQQLYLQNWDAVIAIAEELEKRSLWEDDIRLYHSYLCAALLWKKEVTRAGELLHRHPAEDLHTESSTLHFIHGCWLEATEGSEIAGVHFQGVLETSYPRSTVIGSHFVAGAIEMDGRWYKEALWWERAALQRQLALLWRCKGNEEKASHYWQEAEKEYGDG